MITFLDGTLVEKTPTRVVMDIGGVGYEVIIPLSSFDRLPDEGQRCRILTFDYVREDQHALFGFFSAIERRLFILLMAVNGIGPKLAISALSSMSPHDIQTAIHDRDVKRLSTISGIGRKTAERIILDLHDKITMTDAASSAAAQPRRRACPDFPGLQADRRAKESQRSCRERSRNRIGRRNSTQNPVVGLKQARVVNRPITPP